MYDAKLKKLIEHNKAEFDEAWREFMAYEEDMVSEQRHDRVYSLVARMENLIRLLHVSLL